jgi:uncharacterized protein (DUF4415 family)
MKRVKRRTLESQFTFPKTYRRVPSQQMRVAVEEDMHPRHTKVRVNIYLDQDVVEYFKKRARKPNTQPYQTQINGELRKIMEREQPAGIDERMVERVAERVMEKLKPGKV